MPDRITDQRLAEMFAVKFFPCQHPKKLTDAFLTAIQKGRIRERNKIAEGIEVLFAPPEATKST